MVLSADQFNSRRVQPQGHAFQPRKDGGSFGNCCVFSAEHPVHTTTPDASNVVLLGARRRRT